MVLLFGDSSIWYDYLCHKKVIDLCHEGTRTKKERLLHGHVEPCSISKVHGLPRDSYLFRGVGVAQIPYQYQWIRVKRHRRYQTSRLCLSVHRFCCQSYAYTFSGSQATAPTDFLPKLLRVRLSFFDLTSQTVTNPPLLPVTMICGTFLFQSRHSKSSALAAVFPSRNGFAILFKSEIKSYNTLFSEKSMSSLDSLPRLWPPPLPKALGGTD